MKKTIRDMSGAMTGETAFYTAASVAWFALVASVLMGF